MISTPLHVAFYCNLMGWPKRSGGGVRQWVLTMANALVDLGHQVDILTEAPARKFIDEPLLDARVNRVLLGKGLLAGVRLQRYVRNHPGVRLVAALDYYNIRAARLKRRFGDQLHVMITQRENLSADASWRATLKYRHTVRAVRRHFNDADAVVAVSNGLADDLHDNFGVRRERLHTIYNPAYRQNFVDAADHAVEHPWLSDKQGPVVIAVGRLHHVKGFDDLLRAFAQLPPELGAKLIILGEGKARQSLQALLENLGLQNTAVLAGRVPSSAPWVSRSDLFVLSSRREGLPAVLIEALALGVPVVATRCPSGPEEILESGRLGRLVEVGDIAAMAAAIADVLRDTDIDRAALKTRAAEFSLERALQQYLALWRMSPADRR